CKLSAGAESKELWIPLEGITRVEVAGKMYQIGFAQKRRNLDFEINLLRAEQTNAPGTNMAATYTSFVQLTDEKRGIKGEDHVITMNQPLSHGGYKLYQSGYLFLGLDWEGNQRPVSRSVFTVGRDPGMWLKYLGSTMLALGIVCMFYMKAYFF